MIVGISRRVFHVLNIEFGEIRRALLHFSIGAITHS